MFSAVSKFSTPSISNSAIGLITKHLYSTSIKMKTYDEAVNTLNNLQTNFATIQQVRLSGNKNMDTLLQMFEYSKRIGYDAAEYDKLNLLHVTGTKGKGSTCAFIHSLISQYKNCTDKVTKVGLYTSPHLKSVRERICIDGKPISEEKFAQYFFEVYELLENTNDDPSVTTELTKDQRPAYFKFLTLLSFYVFMKEGVDAAVYEVGIGGELDSTNIIHKPIACGVSSIALDHTFVLGNTVEEISWNKSGIFKNGSSAFSVVQQPGSEKVLRERAAEKGSSFEVVDIHPLLKDNNIKLGVDGDVQKINASLALAMSYKFLKQLDIPIYEDRPNSEVPDTIKEVTEFPGKILAGLAKAHIDGRSQTLPDSELENLTWYIDGSHTVESIHRSSNWWKTTMLAKKEKTPEKFNDSIKVVLFNQQSRNIEELLTELYKTLEDTVVFDQAIFSTNVTWANNKYDINLVSMNVDDKKVDELEMQKRSAITFETLQAETNKEKNTNEITKINVLHDIETGANLVRDLAKQNPEKDIDVFVCGSLHLVGGLLVVLDGTK
ncbi:tetrahydrofolate synthase [Saccharomycopsis crataegensis]|uniref:Folylpolyglutamate synthase n=1 Tax=Saccharomycopsis crataegensis TaxID=43959 RepID=A0AAV5QQS5_9ASCO|nr:tetrahydrofolate synthase [Saccharomycopsis crataegensis]